MEQHNLSTVILSATIGRNAANPSELLEANMANDNELLVFVKQEDPSSDQSNYQLEFEQPNVNCGITGDEDIYIKSESITIEEVELKDDDSVLNQAVQDAEEQLFESVHLKTTFAKEKKRSANFTPEEVTELTNQISKNYSTLYGKVSPQNTWRHKRAAWQAVVGAVNAISPVVRTIDQLKKKFKDIKRERRLKLAKANNGKLDTLGGSVVDSNVESLDETLLKIIEIPGGGFDSMAFEDPLQFTPNHIKPLSFTSPIIPITPISSPTASINSIPTTHMKPKIVMKETTTIIKPTLAVTASPTKNCEVDLPLEDNRLSNPKMTEKSTQTDFPSTTIELVKQQGDQQLEYLQRQTIALEMMAKAQQTMAEAMSKTQNLQRHEPAE